MFWGLKDYFFALWITFCDFLYDKPLLEGFESDITLSGGVFREEFLSLVNSNHDFRVLHKKLPLETCSIYFFGQNDFFEL